MPRLENNMESKKFEIYKNYCTKLVDMKSNEMQDYGDSCSQAFNDLGDDSIVAGYVRISDVYNKFKNFVLVLRKYSQPVVKQGFVEKILLDMALNCLTTLVEIEYKHTSSNANANAMFMENIMDTTSKGEVEKNGPSISTPAPRSVDVDWSPRQRDPGTVDSSDSSVPSPITTYALNVPNVAAVHVPRRTDSTNSSLV